MPGSTSSAHRRSQREYTYTSNTATMDRLPPLPREETADNHTFTSIASSTGSNHGTVTTDSFDFDFNPGRDGADITSTLKLEISDEHLFSLLNNIERPVSQNKNKKSPDMRTTAKKFGRWAPTKQDFDMNTSALGKAFEGFSQFGSSDSRSFSVETGRAQSPSLHNKEDPAQENDTFSKSPYISHASTRNLAELQPHVDDDSFTGHKPRESGEDLIALLRGGTANSNERPPAISIEPPRNSRFTVVSPDNEQRVDESRGPFIVSVKPSEKARVTVIQSDDDQTRTQTQNQTLDFSGDVQTLSQKVYSSNVSSKRQNSTSNVQASFRAATDTPSKPPKKTPTSKTQTHVKRQASSNTTNNVNTNQTQYSFYLPGTNGATEAKTVNSNYGIPVFAHDGKIQSRNAREVSLQNASFGPVDSIVIPQIEEDIYQLIEILKARVFRVENESAMQAQANERLLRESEALKARVARVESENDTHKKTTRQLETEKARVAQLESEHALQQQNNDKLCRESEELEARFTQVEHENAMQKSIITRVEIETTMKTQAIQQLTKELEESKTQAAKYTTRIERVTKDYKELQREKERLEYHASTYIKRTKATIEQLNNEKGDTKAEDNCDFEVLVKIKRRDSNKK